MTAGIYFCMAAMTMYFLSRKPKRAAGRRVTLLYTAFMSAIGLAAFLTTLATLEAAVVEVPARTPLSLNNYYCAPMYVASSLLSTMQFLASDALLVSLIRCKPRSSNRQSIPGLPHIHTLRGELDRGLRAFIFLPRTV
jgi:hypothetical protein